ncbi:MAG: universal stress protein [Acidimicrobiales bacterium]
MFEKVLVAIDESNHAKSVIELGGELARTFNAEVRVLHVLETGFVGRAGSLNMENSDDAHKIVNDAVDMLQAMGILVTGNVRAGLHGRLAVEINNEASDFGANLIIMGSRGLTDFEGLFVGSTSHRLMHVTDLPVMVIP